MNKNDAIELNINNDNSKEYKVQTIQNKAIYIKKSELSYLLGLYYLVL